MTSNKQNYPLAPIGATSLLASTLKTPRGSESMAILTGPVGIEQGASCTKPFPYFMCSGHLLIRCAPGWASEVSKGGLEGVFLAKPLSVIRKLPGSTHQDTLCCWLFK